MTSVSAPFALRRRRMPIHKPVVEVECNHLDARCTKARTIGSASVRPAVALLKLEVWQLPTWVCFRRDA